MNTTSNVDPIEIDKFNHNASNWWDKNGELKTLHDINPARLEFIVSHCELNHKKILDVGCGGGILTESLTKLGSIVTGIDLAGDLLQVAREHAKQNELNITYLQTTIESFAEVKSQCYDIVSCMEMLEHVPDPRSIIQAISQLVKPNGYVFLSTLNRTLKAYLMAIVGAEYILRLLPKKTHDYDKFIRPSELAKWLRDCNLELISIKGLQYQPFSRKAVITTQVDVNYLVCCRKNITESINKTHS